jgi:hypothetical protein
VPFEEPSEEQFEVPFEVPLQDPKGFRNEGHFRVIRAPFATWLPASIKHTMFVM